MQTPWSKQHKQDFAGAKYSLSNSFVQPLTWAELQQYAANNESCQAILQEYQSGMSLDYTPNGGSLDLRTAIANLYNVSDGPTFSPTDHVLVTAGGQVALQLAAQAVLGQEEDGTTQTQRRRRHAIVFTPGYQSTVQSPTWIPNVDVTEIRRRPAQNWQIDVDAVQQAIRPGETVYMVVNEPHNPSGVVMNATTQQALVDLCRRYDIVLVADEVYRLLEHDDQTRIPAFCQVYEKAISIVTMSKPWGACALSLGWCVCQDAAIVQALWNRQYFGTACMARAAECQALLVLHSSDAILQDRRTILRHNKAQLQKVIERDFPDLLSWQCPNAGAIAFVKFKGPLTSAQFGQVLRQHDVSVKPAYCFMGHDHDSPDEDELEQYFRVGFGERQMLSALDAFVAVLEKYQEEWRATMQQQPQQETTTCCKVDGVLETSQNRLGSMPVRELSSHHHWRHRSTRGSRGTTIHLLSWMFRAFLVGAFLFGALGFHVETHLSTASFFRQSTSAKWYLHLWSQQATIDSITKQPISTNPITTNGTLNPELASPRLWLEHQPNGVYTVLRCDLHLPVSRSSEPSWKVWGTYFHLQRLRNSYALLYPGTNEIQLDKAVDDSVLVASSLLANTFHRILQQEPFRDLSCSTVVVMLTLLWYPNQSNDPNTIEVMGHVYTSGTPSSLKTNDLVSAPPPIQVSLAMEGSPQDEALPNRKDFHPRAKQSSWCSLRRPLEDKFKKDGVVGEVLLVDPQGNETQLLEGLTSNCFFVYPGNIIKTPSTNVLEGYARSCVLEAARELDYQVEETSVVLEDRAQWQEVFLSSAIRICQPVDSIVLSLNNNSSSDSEVLWELDSCRADPTAVLPVWREIYHCILKKQGLFC